MQLFAQNMALLVVFYRYTRFAMNGYIGITCSARMMVVNFFYNNNKNLPQIMCKWTLVVCVCVCVCWGLRCWLFGVSCRCMAPPRRQTFFFWKGDKCVSMTCVRINCDITCELIFPQEFDHRHSTCHTKYFIFLPLIIWTKWFWQKTDMFDEYHFPSLMFFFFWKIHI